MHLDFLRKYFYAIPAFDDNFKVPNYVPSVTPHSRDDTNAISFTWEAVPCGMRRGNGLQYQYQLDGGQIMDTFDTRVQFDNLQECTNYWIKVRATNNEGHGDWSSVSYIKTRTISKMFFIH